MTTQAVSATPVVTSSPAAGSTPSAAATPSAPPPAPAPVPKAVAATGTSGKQLTPLQTVTAERDALAEKLRVVTLERDELRSQLDAAHGTTAAKEVAELAERERGELAQQAADLGDASLLPFFWEWLLEHALAKQSVGALSWCAEEGIASANDLEFKLDRESGAAALLADALDLKKAESGELKGRLLAERRRRAEARFQAASSRSKLRVASKQEVKRLFNLASEAEADVRELQKGVEALEGQEDKHAFQFERRTKALKQAQKDLESTQQRLEWAKSASRTVGAVWVVASAPVQAVGGSKVHVMLRELAEDHKNLKNAFDWPSSSTSKTADRELFDKICGTGGKPGLAQQWRNTGFQSIHVLAALRGVVTQTYWFRVYAAALKGALRAAAMDDEGVVINIVSIKGGPISRCEALEMPRLIEEVSHELHTLGCDKFVFDAVEFESVGALSDELQAQQAAESELGDGTANASVLKRSSPSVRGLDNADATLRQLAEKQQKQLWELTAAREAEREKSKRALQKARARIAELEDKHSRVTIAAGQLAVHRNQLAQHLDRERQETIRCAVCGDAAITSNSTFSSRKDQRLLQAIRRTQSSGLLPRLPGSPSDFRTSSAMALGGTV